MLQTGCQALTPSRKSGTRCTGARKFSPPIFAPRRSYWTCKQEARGEAWGEAWRGCVRHMSARGECMHQMRLCVRASSWALACCAEQPPINRPYKPRFLILALACCTQAPSPRPLAPLGHTSCTPLPLASLSTLPPPSQPEALALPVVHAPATGAASHAAAQSPPARCWPTGCCAGCYAAGGRKAGSSSKQQQQHRAQASASSTAV